MRKLILSLLLVLPRLGYAGPVVEAVPVEAAPSFAPETYVDPLLLGSPADPGSPISENLSFHAAKLNEMSDFGALNSQMAGSYLDEASKRGPLDRIAAGALARAATDPASAQRLHDASAPAPHSPLARFLAAVQDGPLAPFSYRSFGPDRTLHRLADSAGRDSTVSSIFDGRAAQASLGLDDLTVEGPRLYVAGEKVQPLGQGGFGVVYPHPLIEGAVIKLTNMTLDTLTFSGMTPKTAFQGDAASTRVLGQAGVGPRLLGTGQISGRSVAVKERVYGPTLQTLIDGRKYGPEQHALVLDMISRMAERRVRVGDMNPTNLMIGRRLVDPDMKTYHIDGGEPEKIEPNETTEEIRRSIYNHVALTKVRFHRDIGQVETNVHFNTMVERGLERSGLKTMWQRFKAGLYDMYFPPR